MSRTAKPFRELPSFRFVGVSDYTRNASQDPADTVIFDLELDAWTARAFKGASVADISSLKSERRLARR
jgi:hypothetical protein